MNQSSALAVAGPTASGKTEISFILARRINGEIINADSQSVYKYFNIGTSRPPSYMRQRIKHHLLSCVDPSKQFNAGDFVIRAGRAMDRIIKKAKIPIVCGGTGLYVTSLIEGISFLPLFQLYLQL